MRLLISAGEASGEMHGAALIAALRRRVPELECFGVGGERMRQAGCETVIDAHQIAVVGLAEVVRHLPHIYGEFRRLLREVDARKADAAVLIDFPDFNLRLARELHRRGIPVVYYISPQLWAWREGRIRQIRQFVKKMLVIFPFEEQWYRERGVEAEFVGHPVGKVERPKVDRKQFALDHGLDIDKVWIALLPGSRRREIAMNLPMMLRAAGILDLRQLLSMGMSLADDLKADSLDQVEMVMALEEAFGIEIPDREVETLRKHLPDDEYEFLLPLAPTVDRDWLEPLVSKKKCPRITISRDARETVSLSRAAVVASGTATVEAAMMGTPFVMVYRVSPLTWTLGRPLVKVPHFAMPNLIAGREVVPELVQGDFTPEKVVAELRKIIPDGPERERMLAGLAEVREKLRGPASGMSAADRAAEAVLKAVGRS